MFFDMGTALGDMGTALSDMGTALSDTVCKILQCAALTAACPESLNELSYLFCHMPTDPKLF